MQQCWKRGINLYAFRNNSFILLKIILDPSYSLLLEKHDKREFTLAITLTRLGIWRMRNQAIFQGLTPFNDTLKWITKFFNEYLQQNQTTIMENGR